MSAQANLAGFYPPRSGDVWNDNLAWQPIPVHTVATEQDSLMGKAPCAFYDDIYEKLMKGEAIQKILKENEQLLSFLTEKTGSPVKTLQDVEFLYSVLEIETLHDFQLPDWTVGVFPEKLFPLAGLSFASRTIGKTLARLKAGPLLKEILEHARAKVKGALAQNYWIYSGHDTTIANMLNTLGVFKGMNFAPPPFASSILFEVHEHQPAHYEVQIFYKNSTNEPGPIEIPGCGFSCPLEKMFEIYDEVIPGDWVEECKGKKIFDSTFVLWCVVGLLLGCALGEISLRRKKDGKLRKSLIPSKLADLQGDIGPTVVIVKC